MSRPAHAPADVRPVPHPWVWAVLYFPLGLAIGFPSVALGYLGSRAGLDVSTIAGIVGMTFLGGRLEVPVGADRRLHPVAQDVVPHRHLGHRASASSR